MFFVGRAGLEEEAQEREAQQSIASRARDDGGFVYAGKTHYGAEAKYLRDALGIKVAVATGAPLDGHSAFERKAMTAYRLARDGIPFEIWTRWTFDQMALYFKGRALDRERIDRLVSASIASAVAEKKESMIRYTVEYD